MAATSNSSATSYASASDMLDFYDIRTIADLISDNSTRKGGSPDPTPAVVIVDTKLARALKWASGVIEAACLRARRYHPGDLHALDGVSKELLIGLVCDLTMARLYRRRPDKGPIPPFVEAAMQMLDALANGERIFSFEENEEAGLPQSHVDTAQQIEERAMVPQQAVRYFGVCADQLNPYQSGNFGP